MVKVLVVDDDKLVRKGLISSMPWSQFGMSVVGEASNGQKALEFLKDSPVDLLLTDLAMPVMSGIDLMKSVRILYPHIHIVVLTLHQDFEFIQEALRLGAIDYIVKVQLETEKFEEVLGRIVRQIEQRQSVAPVLDREGHHFYKDGLIKDPTTFLAPIADELPQQELKIRWNRHDWITNETVFLSLVEELKALQLTQTALWGFLYSIESEWKRKYGFLWKLPSELPASIGHWSDARTWLVDCQKTLRQSLQKPALSDEVTAGLIRVLEIMHADLSEPLTAVKIAEKIPMSRSYFSQCFKEFTGRNFVDYLREIRIDKAKIYLSDTNRTITWIAENTGYEDEKYFSRIFREQTGILPSEFRTRSR